MSGEADRVGQLHEVRAKFSNPAQMQDAVSKLSISGFDRADLSLPSQGAPVDVQSAEAASKPVSTDSDAQQARTLGSSTAAAVAAMAAVGITVATGGAAVPAIAAAVLAGGAAGGATFAVTGAATGAEQHDREAQAASGDLVLSVRAPTPAKQQEAAEILRSAGATDIETVS